MSVQSLQLFIQGVESLENAKALADALEQSKGVRMATISWREGTAYVSFDNEVISADAILQHPALRTGYQIEVCDDFCSS